MNGQIIPNSKAGRVIKEIVERENVINIVESGTWEGGGTTKTVLDSLRNDQLFLSIELYTDVFEKAKNNLREFLNKPNFCLLNGSIIDYSEIFWFDHDKEIDFNSDHHAILWYKKDLENLKNSKNVFDKLPKEIDFLILDGGEWSTYPEWQKLKDRTKIVFLDDTNLFKTKKIREEILKSKRYEIIIDDQMDRNGFSLFQIK